MEILNLDDLDQISGGAENPSQTTSKLKKVYYCRDCKQEFDHYSS